MAFENTVSASPRHKPNSSIRTPAASKSSCACFFVMNIIADGVKIRVKIFLAEILSRMVYTDAIKQQEAMMFMTKKQAQLLLLAAGVETKCVFWW